MSDAWDTLQAHSSGTGDAWDLLTHITGTGGGGNIVIGGADGIVEFELSPVYELDFEVDQSTVDFDMALAELEAAQDLVEVDQDVAVDERELEEIL